MPEELIEADRTAPAWATAAVAMMLADHRSENTRRAYRRDLGDFWQFAGQADQSPADAVRWLCHDRQAGPLALLLNGYKAHLRERQLSETTINRRLAAVRSLIRMARRLGANCPDPAGLVQSEKAQAYRDTCGPEIGAAAQLLQGVDRSTLQGKRDYAMLLLLLENALRATNKTK